MSKATKIWLIVAACLVLVGLIFFGVVIKMIGWDFRSLGTSEYQTKTHEITENFNGIHIATIADDISFVPSNGEGCRVECYTTENTRHSVKVENDTLIINTVRKTMWYEFISINFDTPKITVYLPKTQYDLLFIEEDTGDVNVPNDFTFKETDITLTTGDVNFYATSDALKIKTSTGDVEVEDTLLGSLDIRVTTGEVSLENVKCAGDLGVEVSTGETELDNVTCKNLVSNGSTGSITLKNTVAVEKLIVDRTTGGVKFEGADAGEISVKTDTGSISGTLLSEKVFIAQSDTGRVSVPETTSGGKCKLSTDTGSIKIKIAK